MSWEFDDPWDDYLDLGQRWDLVSGTPLPTIVQGVGRRNSAALKIPSCFISGSGWSLIQKNLPYRDSYIVHAAISIKPGQSANTDTVLFSFMDGAHPQISVCLRPDGHIRINREDTLLADSSAAMAFGEYHCLEVKVTVDPAAGAVTVHLDETEILNLTGINTSATGEARIGALRFGGSYSGAQKTTLEFLVDDFILLNLLGDYNNDFIGDHYLGALYTRAAGDSTMFSLAGADANWKAVRDMPGRHNAGEFDTWVVAADHTLDTRFPAGNVLDGISSTYWDSGESAFPHWLTFDMGDLRTLELLEIGTVYDPFLRVPRTIELYVSADGMDWGSVVETFSEPVTGGDTIFWKLATPQTTRYFKLNITAIMGGSSRVWISNVSAGVVYVKSATADDEDLYYYDPVDLTLGAIAFASIWPYAHKEDGGYRALRAVCKSVATEVDNGADLVLSTGDAYIPAAFETDPDTGDPWTIAGFNAAQFGPKVQV